MGCDIHLFVEVRDRSAPGEPWTHVSFREFYEARAARELGDEEAARVVAFLVSATEECYDDSDAARLQWRGWYSHRNYRLFGFLAGVRCPDVPRVGDPRGIPEDASAHVRYYPHGTGGKSRDEVREVLETEWGEDWEEYWGGAPEDLCDDSQGADWHSRSWCSLRELLEFTMRESLGPEWFRLLDELAELGRMRGLLCPEDVRIVFYFDN